MRFDYHQSVDTCPSINMKFLILSLAFIAAASAQKYQQQQYQQQYQQPQQQYQQPQQGVHQPQYAIVRQASDISPNGDYNYNYETENGISASEQGVLQGPRNADGDATLLVNGQFQYTSPDGTPIQLIYTADENGFQPQGAHLPTPPPIPADILRSLEYNAAHPEQDDSQKYQQPQVQQPQYNRRY